MRQVTIAIVVFFDFSRVKRRRIQKRPSSCYMNIKEIYHNKGVLFSLVVDSLESESAKRARR